MKYLLLIYEDEKAMAGYSDAERQKIFGEYGQLTEDIKKVKSGLKQANRDFKRLDQKK